MTGLVYYVKRRPVPRLRICLSECPKDWQKVGAAEPLGIDDGGSGPTCNSDCSKDLQNVGADKPLGIGDGGSDPSCTSDCVSTVVSNEYVG